jgi:hypothetical protein
MKRILSYSAVIISLGLTASSAFAQTTANGPYYATPSWDQQLPAATRFIVLSNWIDAFHPSGGAAVLDRETGLVWARSPINSPSTWGFAVDRCNKLTIGNRMGWRLPAVQELTSLIDPTTPLPIALPNGHPFENVLPVTYWSASTSAEIPTGTFAFAVSFSGSGGTFVQGKGGSALFWCVRGQQGVEPHGAPGS